MAHPLHLADQHQAAIAEYGHGTAMTIEMRQERPAPLGKTGLEVLHSDPVILMSAELAAQLRRALGGAGGWITDDDVLRIVADNADLTYQLRQIGCGCLLGTQLA